MRQCRCALDKNFVSSAQHKLIVPALREYVSDMVHVCAWQYHGIVQEEVMLLQPLHT